MVVEIRRAVLLIAVLATPAAADPARTVSLRVAGGLGAFEELAWAAPEVDLVGTFAVGGRGFVAVAAGYTSFDSHTFVADGRSVRLAVAGGARLGPRARAAVTLGVEHVGFHADPDVLAEHPDVDLLARRGGLLPSAGVELARALGASAAVGVYARLGLRELTLFETASGDSERARLMLAGVFLELAIR